MCCKNIFYSTFYIQALSSSSLYMNLIRVYDSSCVSSLHKSETQSPFFESERFFVAIIELPVRHKVPHYDKMYLRVRRTARNFLFSDLCNKVLFQPGFYRWPKLVKIRPVNKNILKHPENSFKEIRSVDFNFHKEIK